MEIPHLLVGTERGLFLIGGEAPRKLLEDEVVSSVLVMDDKTFYAGTHNEHGVLRSLDGGQKWEPVNSGLSFKEVWTLAPGVDGSIYAGTEPAALFRSKDGSTWEELGSLRKVPESKDWHSPWGAADLNSIVIDQARHRIYVGIEVGSVVRSDDLGESWRVYGHGIYEDVHALKLDPRNPSTVLANTAAGPYRSDDEGTSWKKIDKGLKNHYTTAITIPPNRPEMLFIATMRGPFGGEPVVYRSLDRGESWQSLDIERPSGRVGLRRKGLCSDRERLYAGLTDGTLLSAGLGDDMFRKVAEGLPPINAVTGFEAGLQSDQG